MTRREPCPDVHAGAIPTAWCTRCEHCLLAHRRDGICSVCEIVDQVSAICGGPP